MTRSRPISKELNHAQAALAYFACHPWNEEHWRRFARQEGLSKAGDTPQKLIDLVVRFIDQETFRAYQALTHSDETPQDRLFDLLMTRFETLEKHRLAILALADICQRTPDLALAMARAQWASLKGSLELLQFSKTGAVSILTLMGIYHLAFCAWRRETDNTLPFTMKLINQHLGKAFRLGLFP